MTALSSFVFSFTIARIFTTISPDTVLIGGGYHIHHFWFGILMLAVGGWLGITVENERINRIAAILFGAGGGLIGDEVGLLLTFGDYWSEITYTAVIVFVGVAAILSLLNRYRSAIATEFAEFVSTNASIYVGVFLMAVSIAFILETDNFIVETASRATAIFALALIIGYFVQAARRKH
jgi:hypothetical protein